MSEYVKYTNYSEGIENSRFVQRGEIKTVELPEPYYEQDGITIYNADCRDLLPLLGTFGLCLTDPPYGIKMDQGFQGFQGFGGFGTPIARRQYNDDWDSTRPHREVFESLLNTSTACLIFGGNYFADILPPSTHWIVWDKLNTMPSFGDCELIWTNVKRKSVKKLTYEYNGLIGKEKFRDHPTQKPLKLIKRLLIDYANGGTVLDPFMGSGTTLVAAKDLGLQAVGIEISEEYCAISASRLRQGVLKF